MLSKLNAHGSRLLAGGTSIAFIMLVLIAHAAAARSGSHGNSLSGDSISPIRSESPGARESLDLQVRQAGADESWWQSVFAQIGRQEYSPSLTQQGFQAPNRAQNLRTTFAERGIEIVPRTGKDVAPAWRFTWETTSFGRPGQIEEVSPSSPSATGARVVYERDGWSEWYENTAKGLEQGFTIEQRPAGKGPLQIAGTFPAALQPQTREDGAVDFLGAHGACLIRYGELHVWDAEGHELPAELVLAGNTLVIQIEDQNATFPLTVDPLMTSPAWIAESNQAVAYFGASVATAGDVNGDGLSDVIVGAPQYDNGQPDAGRAFVYHGSGGGLATAPAWTASDQNGGNFGVGVATAGDVNGDGFSDVIVGAYNYANGESFEGRAFVYHGSAAGLASTPAWTAESNQVNALFGQSVATAGDVNGDGFSDVIVGAESYDNGETDEGRAFVYHGSAAGLAIAPAWTGESNQVDARFGFSVSTAGDVNGDGFSDMIVGAPRYANGETNEGRAFAYLGSATGLATTAAWNVESNQFNALFGWSVSTAGDVNGDGFSDVIVGAYQFDNGQGNEGRAFAYHGSAAGLTTTAAWTAESNQGSAFFGQSVATAGDVNGDGFSDVIVGAYAHDNGEINEGRATAYFGSAAGLAANAAWTVESNQANAFIGISVATAGDVNGDGFSDVIVGASLYDNGETDEGRAFVYHGSPTGPGPTPEWTVQGAPNSLFGASVATAGDVNGDGFSDVIVYAAGALPDQGFAFVYHGSASGLATSPAWTVECDAAPHPTFATPVGAAGDVNGDGFSDVIVGESSYDNGQTDEGRAVVYCGSASGLATAPAWTAESNQVDAYFGWSVATAGDVNGDGYSDVIVGANYYDNGQTNEGRAYLYLGSGAGLGSTSAWTAESDQEVAFFGYSVATAGDVNGDGYADVIVGAHFYDNGQFNEAGRAYVYQGSASGLGSSPAWTAEGDQSEALFGFSTATAGDVNGDGFSDVVVSAVAFDNGLSDEGRAYVYHGSAAGLGTSPVWTATGNQEGAYLGQSVATAGDVNGDGYSDVIVGGDGFDGARGRAFVFRGSVTGLAATHAWISWGNTPNSNFGWSVATAGDVNGDGSSDFIVGAPFEGGGAGAAFVYTGAGTASVEEASAPAVSSLLEMARPNPFGSATEIRYALPRAGRVELAIYDVMGRQRVLLQDARRTPGEHRVGWDGRDASGRALPGGVYFARLAFEGRVEAHKLVLSR